MRKLCRLLAFSLVFSLLVTIIAFAEEKEDYSIFNNDYSISLNDGSERTCLKNGVIAVFDDEELSTDNVILSAPIRRDAKVEIQAKDPTNKPISHICYIKTTIIDNDTFDGGLWYDEATFDRYDMDSCELPLCDALHIDLNDGEINAVIRFEYGLEEKEVMDLISALPNADAVTKADGEAIAAARSAYDSLEKWKTTEPADPDIQNKVTNYDKLTAVEEAYAAIPDTIDLSKAEVKVKAQTYTGKAIDPEITVKLDGIILTSDDYDISKGSYVNAGSYDISISGKGKYTGKATGVFTIRKATQKLTVKANTKSFKAGKLKKKAQTFKIVKAVTVKGQGKISYAAKAANAKTKKAIKVKSGKVTVKKGTKKGLYKIKIIVKAAGNNNYKAASKTVTLTIRVK